MATKDDIIKYYQNLLIIQYHNKDKVSDSARKIFRKISDKFDIRQGDQKYFQ